MNDTEFLATIHPWSTLTFEALDALSGDFRMRRVDAGDTVYRVGDLLEGLYILRSGSVEVTDQDGGTLSTLGPRNVFGERGLMRDGRAATTARALAATELLMLPAGQFRALIDGNAELRDFFARARPPRAQPPGLATLRVDQLMTPDPATIGPETTIADAARIMRDRHISSLMVAERGLLLGILTIRDISGRVVAEGLSPDAPVTRAMTPDPVSLPADAIGSDVLHLMMERGIGHVPILGNTGLGNTGLGSTGLGNTGAGNTGLVGIVTQTDLTRFQAESSAGVIGDVARAPDGAALARATARIPQLLAQLVGAGNRHDVVTRLITDIADAVTRRLLTLAEADLGSPPVPYLWLACGSQGRQEQTGVSDQDNAMMLSDDARPEHDAYFGALAAYVSNGLDECGYVFCPGEMMATTPRWRQPVRVWRKYFRGWIDRPDPMAQMLASVMFDLRPIGGDHTLYDGLHSETLKAASKNSIFVAHMVSNALTHAPPLGLWRGLTTLRAGEHRDRLDLKLSGVVPVVDLGRIYALRGRLAPVRTRARIEAARDAGVISDGGGRDLLDAYDLIAQTRLDHQAKQVRRGQKPDNFMAPADLSEFERSHLRDAFVVVRRMQSAAGQGRSLP